MSATIKKMVSVGSAVLVTRGQHVGKMGIVAHIHPKWNRSKTKVLYRGALLTLPDGRELWVGYDHCEEV